jgi:hypothetical protein
MIKLSSVGLGHWGPDLVRNFVTAPDTRVRAVCDPSGARRVVPEARLRNTR